MSSRKVNITTMGGVTSYPVTIRIDETDGLLPGMNVDVEIEVQIARPACWPSRSVLSSAGNRVLVKTGETVEGTGTTLDENGLPVGYEYREVTLGINDDDYIQITSGRRRRRDRLCGLPGQLAARADDERHDGRRTNI